MTDRRDGWEGAAVNGCCWWPVGLLGRSGTERPTLKGRRSTARGSNVAPAVTSASRAIACEADWRCHCGVAPVAATFLTT